MHAAQSPSGRLGHRGIADGQDKKHIHPVIPLGQAEALQAIFASASHSESLPRSLSGPACVPVGVYVCAACVCVRARFSFPAFIKVAGEIKGGKPQAGHCEVAVVVDDALQVLGAFVSTIFKTPFQPCFPLITALLAAEAGGDPRQWSYWRPACSTLTSCCSVLLILFSCYENTTPPRQGGK